MVWKSGYDASWVNPRQGVSGMAYRPRGRPRTRWSPSAGLGTPQYPQINLKAGQGEGSLASTAQTAPITQS